jgi:hypothetical protein
MNLWLDDKRPMPPEYQVHAFDAKAAIAVLRTGCVALVSLDHDLGPEDVFGDGYDVAEEIERLAHEGKLTRPLLVRVHTASSAGRSRILGAINSAMRFSDLVKLDHP